MTLAGLAHRPAVVVDCDPGIDDALGLLFLARLHHRGLLGLQAVVSVAGNASIDATTRNARFVLARAGLGRVPVIAGSPGPLTPLGDPLDALAFHGPDALGGCFVGDPGGPGDLPLPPSAGPEAIIEHLRQASDAGEAVLLALGPLTNVALALEVEPALHRLVSRVVVMGGAFQRPGNVTAAAEFNWFCDPDAADRVLRSALPLEVVPLDVTERVIAGTESLAGLSIDGPGSLAADLLRASIELHRAAGHHEGSQVHDALAAAMLAEPGLAEWSPLQVTVATAGDHRGKAIAHPAAPGSPRAQVALGVDADRARELIFSVIRDQV